MINFYFILLNLLNRFDGILGMSMHKAAHPSGSVGSSNPCHLRGWRLHHHVDGVCHVVCAFCVDSDSWLVSRTCRMYILEVSQSGPPRLVPYQTLVPFRIPAESSQNVPPSFKEGTTGLLRGIGLLVAHATQSRGWDEFFGGFNPNLFDGIWIE